jgi:hypothetical protein
MGADPSDETGNRRVVRPAPGSNYRLPAHGLSFSIANHDETEAGFITGLQPSDVDAQTITSPPVPESDDERSAHDEAIAFLEDYLRFGAQKQTDIESAARKMGIAHSTLARARQRRKVKWKRFGFGPGGAVWWWLPETEAPLPSSPYMPHTSHTSLPPDGAMYGGYVACMGADDLDRWHGDDPEEEES